MTMQNEAECVARQGAGPRGGRPGTEAGHQGDSGAFSCVFKTQAFGRLGVGSAGLWGVCTGSFLAPCSGQPLVSQPATRGAKNAGWGGAGQGSGALGHQVTGVVLRAEPRWYQVNNVQTMCEIICKLASVMLDSAPGAFFLRDRHDVCVT